MQKKLIALAVAGLASTGALAQSNVTIYGVADASFEWAKVDSAAYNSNLDRGRFNRVNTNSSLIGFRGTEDLGNGMKAVFQYESGVAFDTAGANLGGGRDSFVGLDTKFGNVRLGLLTAPTRALGAAVDMNAGATGPGANSSIIGKVLGGNAHVAGMSARTAAGAGYAVGDMYNNGAAGYNAGFFDTRMSNAIAYISPSFSGFNVAAAYTVGENKNLDTNNNTAAEVNTSGYDLGAWYNNGPIYVGLTYGKVDQNRDGATYAGCANAASATTCSADESSITRVAGKYTFSGGHQIAALWERNKAEVNDPAAVGFAAPGVNIKQVTWGLGGKFMVSPALALIGQYYDADDASISNNAPDGDTEVKLYQLGVEYSLSKRTMLKANYTKMNNGKDTATDFNVGAVGGGFGSGASLSVWQFGMRHTF